MRKKKQNKIQMRGSDIVFNVIAYAVFSVLIIVFAYPFYFLLISTISDNKMVELNKVFLYPIGVHFQNYLNVFKLERFQSSAWVSIVRTGLGTLTATLFTFYSAYFFTKQHMWRRKIWYRFIVTTMYLGAGIIPIYLNFKMLGLLNNFWIYILPGLVGAYNVILMKTFIESLPPSLEESAEIDGAGYLTRMMWIALPLSKPIIATISLFKAVAHWNSFFDTKMYISDPKLYTLQFTLYEYNEQVKAAQEILLQMGIESANQATAASTVSLRLTMTAVTVIPVMCLYPFIQKYYMKGVMIGAIKG